MSDNRSANVSWPLDREIRMIAWGTHPENGDALAVVKVGEYGCARLYAAMTFHGDHDIPWVVQIRTDGTESWYNANSLDFVEWEPLPKDRT